MQKKQIPRNLRITLGKIRQVLVVIYLILKIVHLVLEMIKNHR